MKRSVLGLTLFVANGVAWLGCSEILDFDALVGSANQAADTGGRAATPTTDAMEQGRDAGCAADAFFCDGFEDGILLGNWGGRKGTVLIDTAIFATDRQSLRADIPNGDATAYLEREVTDGGLARFSTEFSMRFSEHPMADRHLVRWTMRSKDPAYSAAVRLMFTQDNTVSLVYQAQPVSGGQDLIKIAIVAGSPAAANEWHRYRVELDLVALKARGFFDGVGVAELNLPPNIYGPSPTKFQLGTTYGGTSTGTLQLWFDDVVMTVP